MSAPLVVCERRFTLIKGGKEVRTVIVASGAAFPAGKLLAYDDGGSGVQEELYLLPDGRRAKVLYFDNECILSRKYFMKWKIADQPAFDRVAPGPA